jgi:hypothetical protein
MGHVAKNVGGIYETPKTVEQAGPVYEYVPKAIQQEAVRFLNRQLFTTPRWLINQDLLGRIGSDGVSLISTRQEPVLDKLLNVRTINKLINGEAALGAKAYSASEMLNDLERSIFSEIYTHKPVDVYRRNLQRMYIAGLSKLVAPAAPASPVFGGYTPANPSKSDAAALGRARLVSLRTALRAAAGSGNTMTRSHLQDLIARINEALNPK